MQELRAESALSKIAESKQRRPQSAYSLRTEPANARQMVVLPPRSPRASRGFAKP